MFHDSCFMRALTLRARAHACVMLCRCAPKAGSRREVQSWLQVGTLRIGVYRHHILQKKSSYNATLLTWANASGQCLGRPQSSCLSMNKRSDVGCWMCMHICACLVGVPAYLRTRAPVLTAPVHIASHASSGPHTAAGWHRRPLRRWPISGYPACPRDGPAGLSRVPRASADWESRI